MPEKLNLRKNNLLFLTPCQKKCLGGGTGRRAGFKIQFFRECGFDSHPRYDYNPITLCLTGGRLI